MDRTREQPGCRCHTDTASGQRRGPGRSTPSPLRRAAFRPSSSPLNPRRGPCRDGGGPQRPGPPPLAAVGRPGRAAHRWRCTPWRPPPPRRRPLPPSMRGREARGALRAAPRWGLTRPKGTGRGLRRGRSLSWGRAASVSAAAGGAEGGRYLTAGGASLLSVCHAHDPQLWLVAHQNRFHEIHAILVVLGSLRTVVVPVLPLASTGAEAVGRGTWNRAGVGRVYGPGTGPILADVYSRRADVNAQTRVKCLFELISFL